MCEDLRHVIRPTSSRRHIVIAKFATIWQSVTAIFFQTVPPQCFLRWQHLRFCRNTPASASATAAAKSNISKKGLCDSIFQRIHCCDIVNFVSFFPVAVTSFNHCNSDIRRGKLSAGRTPRTLFWASRTLFSCFCLISAVSLCFRHDTFPQIL